MKKLIFISVVIVLIGASLGFYILKNKPMENKNTNQQKTSIPSQMNEYRGKFVTFLYANNWKIDEDEQYGMITITNFDSNDRPEFAYSLVRTKFERDSKNSKSFFGFESSVFNVISEKEITINNPLENVGLELIGTANDEGKEIQIIMNVIHLKAVKPINEYFDAVTVSGYRAGSINGIDHYNHEQLVEFVTFFESITINA